MFIDAVEGLWAFNLVENGINDFFKVHVCNYVGVALCVGVVSVKVAM